MQNNNLIMTGRILQGSYFLDFTVLLPPIVASYAATYGNTPSSKELQDLQIWHLRLGYLHHDMIQKLAANGSVNGLRLKTTEAPTLCSGCAFKNSHCATFPKNISRVRATQPGMLIHSDICGPMNVPSHGGSLYYILFQDNHTRYRFVFCIAKKFDALTCFQRVCKTLFAK